LARSVSPARIRLSGGNSDSDCQAIARSNDRTVSVLAPIDEMFFEFLRELENTADRFPPDPRRRRSTAGLRASMARAQEMYRWLETRG